MRPLLVLGGLTGIVLVACGGGDDDASPTPISDPASAVSQAADATAQLPSYHMEITYSPIGAPLVYPVDYDRGNYAEHIPDPETGGSSDYVFHGDNTYRRDCSPEGVCGAWRREPGRLLIPSLVGKVNAVPETLAPYIARMAKDLTLVDAATQKFSGTVDINAATKENQFQAFLAVGNTPSEAADLVLQLWANQPPSSGDSQVEIWLTPDLRYISKLTVYVPTQPTDPYLEIAYSAQNAVTVEPPAGFS